MRPRRVMTMLVRMPSRDVMGMLIRLYRCGTCHAPLRGPPGEGDVCPYCGVEPSPGVAA